MFNELKTSDWVIAVATLLGPILAVQAQKFLERWHSARERRVAIFYTLMGTRRAQVAPAHVDALNRIDMEFRPRTFGWMRPIQSKRDRAVVDAWSLYSQHLHHDVRPEHVVTWNSQGNVLFYDLLYKLSTALGFGFEKSQLQLGIYQPIAHGRVEQLQEQLLENVVKVVKGESSIAMRVTEFPTIASEPVGNVEKADKPA
jgi:hypothetical protein